MNRTQLTRKQFYDLVWSRPLTTLAKEYNISDTGLRKKCVKHNIPLPKLGHWQKLQHGKKVKIIPFPKVKGDENVRISLYVRELNDKGEHILTKYARLTKVIELKNSNLLKVPERLSKPDVLVKEAKINLAIKKPIKYEEYYSAVSTSSGVLSMCMAKENVPRALCFMDALIKLVKHRGHVIEVSESATYFIISEEKFEVRFREKHKRVTVKDWFNGHTELIPNGKLCFILDNYHGREWQDGKKLIEEQLANIMAALEVRADDEKIHRAEREARWAEQKKLKAIKDQEEAKLAWEKKKAEILIHHSTQWNQSKKLRLFIQEVEKHNTFISEKTEDWIKWAKSQQQEIDPLAKGLDMLLSKYEFKEE